MSNEISARIIEVRKALKLSQTEFGNSIGVSRDVIGNIELFRVDPKPLLLDQICKEYKVDRDWLETGEGEMFMPQTKDDVITEFFTNVLSEEDESFRRRFVEMLAGLDDAGWVFLETTLKSLYPDKPSSPKEPAKKEQE